ncbi:hypothetical protein PAXRUDRAFT_19881 [Paxillus rubicundulus Ve08.2h10]|uniref:Uncharacterized protein n=1 Tax=Paxillus rubicundulus Ve08.2h10 TaxID=930991 RepID=A0A0D0DB56_9AGAM|nr:hypothetical protein PAXRUDRAFT_19881 [Paxillus rubicundulus Ve08.2h10]
MVTHLGTPQDEVEGNDDDMVTSYRVEETPSKEREGRKSSDDAAPCPRPEAGGEERQPARPMKPPNTTSSAEDINVPAPPSMLLEGEQCGPEEVS